MLISVLCHSTIVDIAVCISVDCHKWGKSVLPFLEAAVRAKPITPMTMQSSKSPSSLPLMILSLILEPVTLVS